MLDDTEGDIPGKVVIRVREILHIGIFNQIGVIAVIHGPTFTGGETRLGIVDPNNVKT